MAAKKISIIIPTCNRPKELAICLSTLKPQLPEADFAEVLILDDGTSSQSREMAKTEFPWAHWHAGPRRGPAANRNTGAKLARGEWLVFLDDDCIPRDRLIMSYLEAMQAAEGRSRCALIGPTLSPMEERTLLWEAPYNPQGEVLISCNFALPRQLFHELGGFDERFPMAAFEDTDFEARVRTGGIVIQFVPDAAVDHPLRRVPPSRKLALRWEARVISAMDLGASSRQLLIRLPEHVTKIIASRFLNCRLTVENLRAAAIFFVEWLYVIRLLPVWLYKHSKGPRSLFWAHQVAVGKAPRRFGL